MSSTFINNFENSYITQPVQYTDGIPSIFMHSYNVAQFKYTADNISKNTPTPSQAISEEEVDENIKEGKYIPPWEYNSAEANSVQSSDDGYKKASIKRTRLNTSKYFWCEDLKNWCTYVYYTDAPCCPVKRDILSWCNVDTNRVKWVDEDIYGYRGYYFKTDNKTYRNPWISFFQYAGINVWHLYVWNGLNSFVPVNILQCSECEIKNKQDKIINGLFQYAIHRGDYRGDKTGEVGYWASDSEKQAWSLVDGWNSTWHFDKSINEYFKNFEYRGAGLQPQIFGSWVEETASGKNYQKQRGSVASLDDLQPPLQIIHGLKLTKQTKYTILDEEDAQCMRVSKTIAYSPVSSGNATSIPQIRQGLSCGNPALMKAGSDLILCAYLAWGGTWGIMGTNESHDPQDFINDMCIRFFGQGKDKTIASDWLNLDYAVDTSKEVATSLVDIKNADDETLSGTLISQNNLVSNKKCKMTFNVNDINISVNANPDNEVYVAEKW